MKRYSMEIDISESSSLAKKVKVKEVNDENGQWVRYDDIKAVETRVCKWHEVNPYECHKTECGKEWFGLFIYNIHFNFCPFCGGRIEVVE